MSLSGIGEVADLVKGVLDRFFPPEASPELRAATEQALIQEISNRDKAKAQIISAEMQQQDNYTKRARPTVVYGGLVMIAINYVIFPLIGRFLALYKGADVVYLKLVEPLQLPTEFWVAWGGVVGTWILGRSAEKIKGTTDTNVGRLVSLITGNK